MYWSVVLRVYVSFFIEGVCVFIEDVCECVC